MATKSKTKPRTTTRKTPAKPKPEPVQQAPKPPPAPKHSPGSLARRKATLISALKSPALHPVRELEIRAELEQEPMASTPILSPQELRRLED